MAHIILNDERLHAFSLKLGRRQGCPPSPTLIQQSRVNSSHCNKARKGNEALDWKGKSNNVPFTEDLPTYKILQNLPKDLQELISEFGKVTG